MSRVQYSHPQLQINETKPLKDPMREGVEPWIRAARRVFPDAPKGYYNTDQIITDKSILLRFECLKTGDRYAFVIER